MKKFIIEVDFDIYIATAPDIIVDNIKTHKKSFLKWLNDKKNNHGLWIIRDKKKCGLSYSAKDFIEYLNVHIISNDEKAGISKIQFYDNKISYPKIYL